MKQKVEISGMSCGGCVSSVKKALSNLKNVESVEVTLDPPIAVITSDTTYTDNELSKHLSDAGSYSLAETDLHKKAPKSGGSCCC